MREFKSDAERQRYTVQNCSLNAKFLREKKADRASNVSCMSTEEASPVVVDEVQCEVMEVD